MFKSLRLTAGVLAVAAVLLAGSAWGQEATGIVTGAVTDASGGAVVNASVVVTNTGTAAESKTTTNASGEYTVVQLPPGMYTVTVAAPGFRKTKLSEQRLIVASTLHMNVSLEVGQVNESVTVDAAAPQVNTDDAQLGQALINIPDLPLLSTAAGRNVLNLIALQSGVSMTDPSNSAATSVGPFSVNGQRTQANNFLLDGADDNDLAINYPDASAVISPNAIGEFRVITGPMNAEYGRNSGAVIESTIKSGANSFHGQAEDFLRNTVLNANNFFLNSVGSPNPKYIANDYDASVGGPIKHNKTFFFASYLGFRREEGEANSGLVFSDAERAAILANGVPTAKAMVNLTPLATNGGDLWIGAPIDSLTRNQGVFKIDQRFSEKNTLSVSLFTERNNDLDPYAFGDGVTVPGFGQLDYNTFYNATLHDTHTFGPHVINEATAAFHRLDSPGVVPLNTASPQSLGFTGISPDNPSAAGPPFMFIDGIYIGNTYEGPQARQDDNWQFRDSVTWVKGRHTFKFGAEFDAYEQNQIFTFINNGYFQFLGTFTDAGAVPVLPGLQNSDPAINDFANGASYDYDQANNSHGAYRDKFLAFYAQDDFKIARNLTMNIGMRYDYGAPITDLYNRVVTFNPGQQSSIFPTAPTGMVYPGDKGISNATYPGTAHEFQPRLGFAWDPTGSGKLSLRAGFGMFYNDPETELTLQFLGAPPYGTQVFVNSVTNDAMPYQTSSTPLAQNPFPFTPVKPGQSFNFANLAPVAFTIMDPHFQTPYAFQYDFQVQYQVARNWVAEAAYVGTQGRHLESRTDIDPALPSPDATSANEPFRNAFNINNPEDAAYGGAVFGGITDQSSNGNSNYNSLQLSLQKRYSYGLQLTNAYTWSHCIDDVSGLRGNLNPFNATRDIGNCSTDVRQSYTGSAVYELPWYKDQQGFRGHLLGGVTLSTVVTLQSGIPFDIFDDGDRSLTGAGDDRPNYIGGNVVFVDPRANAFYGATGNLNNYFDGEGGGTASGAGNPYFARVGSGGSVAQGAGYYGDFGRNVFHGPGELNTDVSVSKATHFTETQSLILRAQAFNFFNHTQFYNPDGDIADSTFGQISTAHNARIVQLSLQYMF
jgi:hypothetical protein